MHTRVASSWLARLRIIALTDGDLDADMMLCPVMAVCIIEDSDVRTPLSSNASANHA